MSHCGMLYFSRREFSFTPDNLAQPRHHRLGLKRRLLLNLCHHCANIFFVRRDFECLECGKKYPPPNRCGRPALAASRLFIKAARLTVLSFGADLRGTADGF